MNFDSWYICSKCGNIVSKFDNISNSEYRSAAPFSLVTPMYNKPTYGTLPSNIVKIGYNTTLGIDPANKKLYNLKYGVPVKYYNKNGQWYLERGNGQVVKMSKHLLNQISWAAGGLNPITRNPLNSRFSI